MAENSITGEIQFTELPPRVSRAEVWSRVSAIADGIKAAPHDILYPDRGPVSLRRLALRSAVSAGVAVLAVGLLTVVSQSKEASPNLEIPSHTIIPQRDPNFYLYPGNEIQIAP